MRPSLAPCSPLVWLLLCCLSSVALVQPAAAQEAETPTVETAPEETTVYVPYEKLAEVFEKEGRGVFLPYEKFLELWKAAGQEPPVPPSAPVSHVITSASYTGRVNDRTCDLTLALELETLRKGWIEVVLPLDAVAIRSVAVTDEQGEPVGDRVLVNARAGGLQLVVREPGKLKVDVELTAEVSAKPGEKRLALAGPRGAVTRLDLVIPEDDVLVEVEPAVAETREAVDGGGTRVLAFLADVAGGGVSVVWEPERAEAADVQGHVFGDVAARVWVEEGLVRYAASVDYSIIQTSASELVFSLPSDIVVLDVSGANLREWVPEEQPGDETRTRYRASLYEPAKGNYQLTVRAERSLPADLETLAVPALRLVDVAREKGTLGIGAVPALALGVASREGLVQISPGDLPKSTRTGASLAFRYLRHPYELSLAVTRVQPRVTASVRTTVSLRAEGVVDAKVAVDLSIKKAGIFEVTLDLPEGFDLREVGPDGIIDDYRVTGEGAARALEITFSAQQTNQVVLNLSLETFRPDVVGDLVVPFVGVQDVERENGVVGIAAEQSLKVSTSATTGLTPVDVRELPGSGVQQLRGQEPLLFGFRYHSRPVAATVRVERKSPKVTASLQTQVQIAGGAERYSSTLSFGIQFSGVDQFRFQLPAGFQEEDVRIEGPAIKTTRREAGANGEPDTWVIETQSPRLGSWVATVSYDRTLADVRAGQEVQVDVPLLVVLDVERQTGHIAVLKEENLEITPEPSEGLEPIDTLDLPTQNGDAFLAFRYLDPGVSLRLGVTRHEFEPVIPALVEAMLTHSVVDETGLGRHVSVIQVKNTSEQFLHIRLPAGVEPLGISVNGQDAPLQRSGELYLVQLPVGRSVARGGRQIQSETIQIVINWSDRRDALGSGGSFTLEAPRFENPGGERAVPVLQQFYLLHVPANLEYYDFGDDLRELRRVGGFWEYVRSVLSALIPTIGGDRSHPSWGNTGNALANQLRSQSGISTDILGGMREFRFDRRQGGGSLTVEYTSQGRFYLYCLILFVLGLVAGTQAVAHLPISKNQVAFGLFFVPIVLGPFFSPTSAMLLGCVSLAGLALALYWWFRSLGDRPPRAPRPAAAPTPPSDGADDAGAAGEAPATSGKSEAKPVKSEAKPAKSDSQKSAAKESKDSSKKDSPKAPEGAAPGSPVVPPPPPSAKSEEAKSEGAKDADKDADKGEGDAAKADAPKGDGQKSGKKGGKKKA